jgi:hypothetical protein
MKSKTVITVLLIAIVLASCQTVATPHVKLTETPISTSVLFTETAEPTITAKPLQIPSPTELPFDVNVLIEQSVVSPSGEWLALVMITKVENEMGNKNSSMLVIVNQQNSAERTVEKIDFTSWLGYSVPWSLAWSDNEDYLYYTHRFGGGDGCFGEDDFFGTDLYRFDLDSGELIELAPKLGYWLALSPDQSMVAFLTNDNKLRIRNLETGEERETSIEEQLKYSGPMLTHASNLIWSLDSKELLLTLQVNVCVMEDDATNSIIKVDAETLSQKPLILEDPNRPITLEWADNDLVLVQDESSFYWWLNPVNGQMTERK